METSLELFFVLIQRFNQIIQIYRINYRDLIIMMMRYTQTY